MPVNTASLVRVIGIACLFLLVTLPSGSIAKTPRFEADQLVRFVLENRTQWHNRYHRKVIMGTLTFDDKYRHPFEPPGPAPIDCARTSAIGVTFLVKRKTKSNPETIRTYNFWAHSNVELGDYNEKHEHVHHFRNGQNGIVVTEVLRLTDKMRVDGTITIRVEAGRHEVLQNSFSLSHCPRTN